MEFFSTQRHIQADSSLRVRITKDIGTPNSLAQPVMLLTRTGGACLECRILYRLNWRLFHGLRSGSRRYHCPDHGSITSLKAYIRRDIPWQSGADGKYKRNTLYDLKSGHDHILFGNDFNACRYNIYLTATGLTAGGSSTVHIYTQTVHRIQRKEHT
jgi:hypothetical protein